MKIFDFQVISYLENFKIFKKKIIFIKYLFGHFHYTKPDNKIAYVFRTALFLFKTKVSKSNFIVSSYFQF